MKRKNDRKLIQIGIDDTIFLIILVLQSVIKNWFSDNNREIDYIMANIPTQQK